MSKQGTPLAALLLVLGTLYCSKGSPTTPTPRPDPEAPRGGGTAVLIGAGDIGLCGSQGAIATGRLIENTLGEVFLAGDIGYSQGSAANFRECFEPVWGHARGRWRPVPGNHEYESPNAVPYFQYFGAAAGPPDAGYYRFFLGEWLILMLNSNIAAGPTSAQYQFVRESLSRPVRCQMAIWHHPVFTSGPNGPSGFMRDMYKLLDDNEVDVVVNGHDHLYERFSRQDADGRQDPLGIREFIVGTGGAQLYSFVTTAPNSTVRISTYGIMRFTLRPDAYDWDFLETSGALGDNGTTECH
ncbi:MAG TPA: metallophosphoesterase [Vicinamibacterales bacterium]|nr:metallophosphoesterase [Vicinamibacterales bacterium]